jgi:hypothetical protein
VTELRGSWVNATPALRTIGRGGDARTFEVLGTRVSVSVDDASLLVELDRLLAPFAGHDHAGTGATLRYAVVTDPEHEGVVVGRSGERGRPVDRRHALAWLLADLNARVLDGYGGFAAHAGVVAHDDRALCLPADSGAGKSTLVAACVAAGLAYVSDEALCLDPSSGRVAPYPRPIALAPDALALVADGATSSPPTAGEHLLTAADLGGCVVRRPPLLADVVLLERRPGPPELEPLEPADAMAALLSRSFNLYRDPDGFLELVAGAARRAQPWRLRYDAPNPAAALLAEHLA